MGCFSTVCCVSKLPIYNHKMVAIPIIKNIHGSSCYANWMWNINGFPIVGECDTYGCIEKFEDKANTDRGDIYVPPYLSLNKSYLQTDHLDKTFEKWLDKNRYEDMKESLMYIHRPVWDEIQRMWREDGQRRWDSYAKRNQETLIRKRKAWEDMAKKDPKIIPEVIEEMVNWDGHPDCPKFDSAELFEYDFIKWCQEHYTEEVKEGLISMLALDHACTITHTYFNSPWTIGEQISDWSEEQKWNEFLSRFIKKTIKTRD